MKHRNSKAALYARLVAEQRRWIEEHGGSLAAYVARYGLPGEPRCYGNGGPAIYAADMAALGEYERKLRRATGAMAWGQGAHYISPNEYPSQKRYDK